MSRHRRLLAQLLAILAVFALFAAACGDDDDEGADATDDTSQTDDSADETAEDDSGDEMAEDDSADDAGDDGSADDGGMEECMPGGASDTGITEDSIKITLVTTQTGGNSGGNANFVFGAEAYLEWLNENGGICGRTVDWDTVDDESDSNRQAELMRDAIDGGSFAAFLGSGQYADPETPCSQGFPVIGTAFAVGWHFCDSNFGANAGSWAAADVNNLPPQPSAIDAVDGFIMSERGVDTMVTLGYSIASSADSAANTCDVFNGLAPEGMSCAFTDGTVEFGFSSAGATTARIEESGARHFYAAMDIVGCVTYVNEIRTAGVEDFTFRCAVGIDDANIEQFGDSLEPIVIASTTPNFTSDLPAMVEFVDELGFRKPGQDPDQESLNGWNAAKFFHRIMLELGPEPTQEGFVDAVRNGDSETATAWSADGMIVPVDWTENRWDAIEAGTYTPAPGCNGTLYGVDFDAGAWVPLDPDPLCLSGLTGEDIVSYAEETTSAFEG